MPSSDPPGSNSAPLAPRTRLAHKGRDADRHFGMVNVPPHRASTILFETAAAFRAGRGPQNRFSDKGYSYGRRRTPSTDALIETLIDLDDGAAYATLTPSGAMAISTALLSVLRPGDHLLVSDGVYRPTRKFCNDILTRMDVAVDYFPPRIGAAIAERFGARTKAVFLESPSTATFEVQDVPELTAAARRAGAVSIIDNSWATPLFFNPLTLGAEIVVHSLTKYAGGHSDVLMGAITAVQTHAEAIELTRKRLGVSTAADDAYLILRGFRSLDVRLAQHQRSGFEVAEWLQNRPEVLEVLHPGLPSSPDHALWRRDFRGAASLFGIVLRPETAAGVDAMLDALALFGMGYSWGGFESLAIPVSLAKARTVSPSDLGGPLLRLYIGLEDPGDLIADLDRGFAALRAALDA